MISGEQGGGGLPGCSDKGEGSSVTESSTGASASSRGLPKRRGGRNSKYIASKCITGQQAELDVF